MKKLSVIFTFLLLATLTKAQQTISPATNQVWWGYFSENDFGYKDAMLSRGRVRPLMACIRIPANKIATAIEQELGHPILTTSVPAQDDDYRCEPELIAEALGAHVDIVVDSGRGGLVHSTVVDYTGSEPEIIRQGKGELS